VTDISAVITGPSPGGGVVASVTLDNEGLFLWKKNLNTSGWAAGRYEIQVSGTYEDGVGIFLTREFDFTGASALFAEPRDDWPMFRRGKNGDAFTARPLVPPLELVWTQPVPGMVGHNSPVVDNGRVFFGFRTDKDPAAAGLMAFDCVSGSPLWHRALPGGMALAPGVVEGAVIANALNDSVYAFAAQSGGELWSLGTPKAQFIQAAPIGDENGVFVSSKPYGYMVHPLSGAVLWQSDYIGVTWYEHVYTAAAVSDSRVFLNTYGGLGVQGGLSILDRSDGSHVVPMIPGTYRAPVLAADSLFVIGDATYYQQKAMSMDLQGGVRWTSTADVRRGMGAPALANGRLVFPARDGTIKCVDSSTGQELWARPVGEARLDMVHGAIGGYQTLATPAIAADVVYIGSLDGHLYALDLYDGEILWNWDFGVPIASSAALSGNMLFVGSSDGNLYAFMGMSDFEPAAVDRGEFDAGRFFFRAEREALDQATVTLEYALPQDSNVELAVYDLRGARIATLVNQVQVAGSHRAIWQGRDRTGKRVAAGMYFARIVAGGTVKTVKVIMVH
jgi:outer membrane protein assembly factor BamB